MLTDDAIKLAVVRSIEEAKLGVDGLQELVDDLRGLEFSQMTFFERGLVKIYNAINGSLPVINIRSAIHAGGYDDLHRPCLAIAQYDASLELKETELVLGGFFVSKSTFAFSNYSGNEKNWISAIRFNSPYKGDDSKYRVKTPLVPPQLRVKDPEGVAILFEVDEWKEYKRDPYLVRRVAGDIFTVLGSWNISKTELKAFQAARDLGIKYSRDLGPEAD